MINKPINFVISFFVIFNILYSEDINILVNGDGATANYTPFNYTYSTDSVFKTTGSKTYCFILHYRDYTNLSSQTHQGLLGNTELSSQGQSDSIHKGLGFFMRKPTAENVKPKLNMSIGHYGRDFGTMDFLVDGGVYKFVIVYEENNGANNYVKVYVDGGLFGTVDVGTTELDAPDGNFVIGNIAHAIEDVKNLDCRLSSLQIYNGIPNSPENWNGTEVSLGGGVTSILKSANGSGIINESGLSFTEVGSLDYGSIDVSPNSFDITKGASEIFNIVSSQTYSNYSISNSDFSNISINTQSGQINYTFDINDPDTGAFQLNFTHNSNPFSALITLNLQPDPPVINSQEVLTAVVGYPYIYTISAEDSFGSGGMKYYLDSGPNDMDVDLITGAVDWTPSQGGPVSVGFYVEDAQGEISGIQTFSIDVTAEPENLNLDFNDAIWQTVLDSSIVLKNSEGELVNADGIDLSGVIFKDNGTGGTSLHFSENSQVDSPIVAQSLPLSNRFMIETKLKLSDIPLTERFIPMNLSNTAVSDEQFNFFLEKNSSEELVVKFELLENSGASNGLELTASQTISVWKDTWVHLIAEIWYDDVNSQFKIKVFHDYALLGSEIVVNVGSDPQTEWVWSNMHSSVVNLNSLSRSYSVGTIDVDFIRINHLLAPYDNITNTESYGGEIFIEENSSVSIVLDGNPVANGDDNFIIKRIINSPSEITSSGKLMPDVTLSYEPESQDSVFHGIFEINFGLLGDDFLGDVIVDILIKKPNEEFKRIGSALVTVDTNQEVSWHQYYWNSRLPFTETPLPEYANWSSDDADTPFRENVSFKFILR